MLKTILRLVTALVFIFSGLVKAIDPVGFSFKLEEYFSPSVFNLPFLEEWALPLAVFIVLVEVLLGVALLIGYRLKLTLSLLIALCVFFAFLTFYSAYFQVVTDCGCFGDAMKLTPWQSFWKDIVLLVFLLVLYKAYYKENPSSTKAKTISLIAVGLITIGLSAKGIVSEPFVDFRDYKIGTDLSAEKQKLQSNPAQYRTVYHLVHQETGETKVVGQDDYLNDTSLWEEGSPWSIEQDKTSQEKIKEGYESEVSKLRLEDRNGNDLTEKILSSEHVVLLFSYDPSELSNEERIQAQKKVQGHPLVYGVSTNLHTFSDLEPLKMDPTAIKTIARSNPFVVVLHKGVIVEKKPINEYQP